MPDLDPPTRPGPLPWRERLDVLTQPPAVSPARIVAGAGVAAALAIVAWLLVRSPEGPPPETFLPMADAAASTTSSSVPSSLLVHAAGAVQRPGVYELRAGARVTDLIDAAGGPTADADVDQLNLAALVTDGERIYVPRVGEIVAAAAASGSAASPSGPLNLNTATLDQLDELPGVGPATAQAIIDERERRGGFSSVDDLLDVRGIGPAKLEALRDLVRV